MGTRSLTRVFEDGQQVVNMYRQFDGYPSGHGKELFDFLDGLVVVNGLSGGPDKRIANGAGCLAAQLVSHFKTEPGGIYLVTGSPGNHGQEYEYQVRCNFATKDVNIVVKNYRKKVLFEGSVADFGIFCDKEDE